jgi:hypothetical protein
VAELILGLNQWGGPAYGTELAARAMGFASLEDLYGQAQRLMDDLAHSRPLSRLDWTRALLSLELAFGSQVLGCAREWGVVQGGEDAEWLRTLRSVQRKLPASRRLLPG